MRHSYRKQINKFKVLSLLLSSLLFSSFGQAVESYPWMSFDRVDKLNYFEVDLSSSYFIKNDIAVFTGVNLEYHGPLLDVDFGYRYSFLDKEHYPRFGELSLSLPLILDRLNLVLGFRDFMWSEADRYWNLGLWQPRYLVDVFRPLQTSLPGVYVDFLGDTSITAFVSHFYLPDIMIYPELSEGEATSHNPFFSSSFLDVSKVDTESLKSIDWLKFVLPMAGIQIRHDLSYSDLSLSYAYKPINQLHFLLKSEGINLSVPQSKLTVKDIDYTVLHHHLFTFESEFYLSDTVSIFSSLLYEKPEQVNLRELKLEQGNDNLEWLTDNLESHLIVSFLALYQSEIQDVEKMTLSLGYMKIFENQEREEMSNAITEDLESLFGREFDWKHALSGSVEYWTGELFSGARFNLRVNYSLDNNIYAIIFDNYFSITPFFQVYMSGDIFFSFLDKGNQFKLKTSSVRKYKDSSRVLIGGKYVF